jgi:prepilin-type processing-associated H-X9-DG protein
VAPLEGGADLNSSIVEGINVYLNRINYLLGDGHAAAVVLPDKLFPPSYTYHFRAVIRNWLGSTATSQPVLVTKASLEMPVATIKGEGTTKLVDWDEKLTVEVTHTALIKGKTYTCI